MSGPVPSTTDALRLDAWIGAVLVLLGATTTGGWLLHLPALVQIVPGLVPMVFNTGLGFVLVGAALVVGTGTPLGARIVRTGSPVALVALCTATAVEFMTDHSLGIDLASLHAWFDYGNTRPGRMAPNTALAFSLAGTALLVADRVRGRASAIATIGLTFGLLAVGLTGLVGYLLAPDLLFNWARSARMAVHTAFGLILAAFGIWSSWSRRPWYTSESHFRDDTKIRLVGAVILAIVTLTAGLTGFVLLQHSFEQTLENRLADVIDGRAPRFREMVEQSRVHAAADLGLTGIASSAERWLAAPGDETRRLDLARDAARLLGAGYRGVTIERVDGSVAAQFGKVLRQADFLARLDGSVGTELGWDGQSVLRTRHDVGDAGDRLVLERLVPEMARSLFDTARLGESAEVGACVQRGSTLLCLPNSRNATPYRVTLRGGASPLPMERALAGGHGIAYTVDYRGRNVVAAFGLLAPGLGLIAKEDTTDAYSPIRQALSMGVPIILLVTLLGASLMTWQLSPLVARLRRSEQLASEAAAKTAAIMQAAGDGIVTIDHLGRVQAANEAAHRIFGFAEGDLMGRNVGSLMPACSQAAYAQGLAPIATGGMPQLLGAPNAQLSGLRGDGTEFPVELTLSTVLLPGHPIFVGVMRDITERRALEEKLSHLAQFDSLTGLPNRALFLDRLNTAMARTVRSDRALAIMFLDLDSFKAINDTWGHYAGDEVLVQVAKRLVSVVRRTDTAARLAGDEFTILLEDLTHPDEDARAVAEKVLEAMREPMMVRGHLIHVTASIGLTLHEAGSHSSDASELLSRADGAMYAAKRSGKNAVRALACAAR